MKITITKLEKFLLTPLDVVYFSLFSKMITQILLLEKECLVYHKTEQDDICRKCTSCAFTTNQHEVRHNEEHSET